MYKRQLERTLSLAEAAAEETKEAAKAEAEQIIDKAKLERDEILSAARTKVYELEQEMCIRDRGYLQKGQRLCSIFQTM